jgi:hypothetical protein
MHNIDIDLKSQILHENIICDMLFLLIAMFQNIITIYVHLDVIMKV